jgi:hypothetical protein
MIGSFGMDEAAAVQFPLTGMDRAEGSSGYEEDTCEISWVCTL